MYVVFLAVLLHCLVTLFPQSVDLPAVLSSLASCSFGIVGSVPPVVQSAMDDTMWAHLQLQHTALGELPDLVRSSLWLYPISQRSIAPASLR